jgi:hypothetical protein
MSELLNRFWLRLANIRALEEENERLRSQVSELESRLSKSEQQADLRLEVAAARSHDKPDGPGCTGEPCLWVPPGHFYSPIVNAKDEAVQRAMDSEASSGQALEAFGIDEARLLHWFNLIAEHYAEQPFPEQPSSEGGYFYANPNFPLADALALLTFMVRLRPARFIEIGAGYSSCAAIDVSERHLDRSVHFTFVDPHPELALQLIRPRSSYAHRFLRARLQDVPVDLFARLERNDILFIDSSHVAKTASDVLDYLFRVIPSLNAGVIVHIHDIFCPFEYPRAWIEEQNRSWNEAYILRAYLHGASSLRVLYWSDWFFKCRRSLLETRMPLCATHRGGSLWLEKL